MAGLIVITPYRDEDYAAVAAIWADIFRDDPEWNRPEIVIPAKQTVQPDLFLLARDGSQVVGTILAGFDGHRGWIYRLAVARSHQRQGIATRLVDCAEQGLAALGCPKINLQIRPANEGVVAFYRALGYEVEPRIDMGKRLPA